MHRIKALFGFLAQPFLQAILFFLTSQKMCDMLSVSCKVVDLQQKPSVPFYAKLTKITKERDQK